MNTTFGNIYNKKNFFRKILEEEMLIKSLNKTFLQDVQVQIVNWCCIAKLFSKVPQVLETHVCEIAKHKCFNPFTPNACTLSFHMLLKTLSLHVENLNDAADTALVSNSQVIPW